jgi:hypothetical protein
MSRGVVKAKDGTYVTISKCNCGMSLLRQKTKHIQLYNFKLNSLLACLLIQGFT